MIKSDVYISVIEKFEREGLEIVNENIDHAMNELFDKEFIKEEKDYIIYLPQ
jgi:hypothetical protein